VSALDTFDVVVVGSGVIGAACAFELALAGRRVLVVDRGHLTGGTTASGEGNVLVSDKPPGPELDLARASVARWRDYSVQLAHGFEYEPKGGVVLASDDASRPGLLYLAVRHREVGLTVQIAEQRELRTLEPYLAHDLELGAFYPDDAQVQPVLASSALLAEARSMGAEVRGGVELVGIELDTSGRVAGVRLRDRDGRVRSVTCDALVNAAGPWSPAVAQLAGSDLPVRPRKGHLLVTEPVRPLVHHKVYEAGYVDTLTADTTMAQVSAVVESTPSGTILLGSSRELVGFEGGIDLDVVRRIAVRARRLFPVLADVALLRTYVGFRPWVPDHLPIIGEDPDVAGLWHATGHEGAGIGLAPATAQLVRAGITRTPPPLDPTPFLPDRPSLLAAAGAAAPSGGTRSGAAPTPPRVGDAGGRWRSRARRGQRDARRGRTHG
jgi:D-hydroxyproline dehydrogenase subunit beta